MHIPITITSTHRSIEDLKTFSNSLGMTIDDIVVSNNTIINAFNELMEYMEFIRNPDEDPSFHEWSNIKYDEEKLKKYKRNKTINEIINN
tara:strand:+ start:16767 stop:17036 length:270 start_codon:yes stop_codon:yes gene_type:complete